MKQHQNAGSACRAYADGMAVEEIARTFGISTTSLYRNLRRLGVPLRDDNQKRKARMIEMFEAGASLTEVSEAVGITIRGARERALELGFRAPRSTPEKRGPVVGQIWERGTRRIRITGVGHVSITAAVLPDERERAVFTIKGLLFGYRLIVREPREC